MESGIAKVVLSHQAERSILHDRRRDDLQSFVVAGRPRLATCSGVAWFRGYHLAVVNLYGQHLRIYRFHSGDGAEGGDPRLELLHEMLEGLRYPEDVTVSGDGSLLALTHSMSDDLGVTLHRLDAASLAPDPCGTTLRRGTLGSAFHGLDFSPDARHLAFTQIGERAFIEVVRVRPPAGRRTCLLEHRDPSTNPKAVAFSFDGRYLAICRATSPRPQAVAPSAGMVAIHRFDPATGIVDPAPTAQFNGVDDFLAYGDLCAFLPPASPNRHRLLVADQALNAIMTFEFDAEARTLAHLGVLVAGMPFPHGVSASADGRFVAITSYGDDTLHIVRMPR